MPFNGAGTFSRIYSWVTDAANNLNVDATRTDTDTNDIASGLTNCICKDGQSTPTANIPMGGFKVTNLGAGSSTNDAVNFGQLVGYAGHVCEGRLTLTSGTPVTTSDVTAAGTLYFTPYKGNKIALYDGSNWLIRTFTELSIAMPATATNPYDVFVYDNSGTPALEILIWTNSTTRATALTTQDGVLVKSGAVTRRYLGTIVLSGANAITDSLLRRGVWNYYNRAARPMRLTETTDSWTYNVASTWRNANGNGNNVLQFVVGVVEDMVNAEVMAFASNNTLAAANFVGIGLDSNTAIMSGLLIPTTNVNTVGYFTPSSAAVKFYPSIGFHLLEWLEATSGGTATFYGDNGSPAFAQSGMHAVVWG